MHRRNVLGALRWPAILLLAASFAYFATYLGRDAANPSVLSCDDPYCTSTTVEYESYGWPVPWRTEAPPDAVRELTGTSRLRQFGLGIADNGVSYWALGATLTLWFLIGLGALVLADAVAFRRWRSSRAVTRLVLPVSLVFALAALLTVLGTLRTSSGVFNGIVPYESAGLPFEWQTSPWLRAEPESNEPVEALRAALRPSNMLGFSPLYLSVTFFAWTFVSAVVVLAALRVAPLLPKVGRLRELATPAISGVASRRPEGQK